MSDRPGTDLVLHPLLRYYQHEVVQGHCTSILWDLREAPSPGGVRDVTSLSSGALTDSELIHPATTPPVQSLRITCGFFPEPWLITAVARRSTEREVVTVLDVLNAIHACLQKQLTHPEWDRICAKHQQRISAVFDARWRVALDPPGMRACGLLRVDCLLSYTGFGGLTVISKSVTEYGEGCILTLWQPR